MATADSGPLRHRYGGVRDLVVGVTVVPSDGTLAKAGGKVIKNVAGYDLAKLFAGSFAPQPAHPSPHDPARHVSQRSPAVSTVQAASPPDEQLAEILSADALAFVGELQRRFGARRAELLQARSRARRAHRLPRRDARDPRR